MNTVAGIDRGENERRELKIASEISEVMREPMMLLDHSFIIQYANTAFREAFHHKTEEIVGKKLDELLRGGTDLATLRHLLEANRDRWSRDCEQEYDLPGLGPRLLRVCVRRVEQPSVIFLRVQDITEQAQTRCQQERLLRQAQDQLNELQSLYDNAPIGLALFDRDLRFRRVNSNLAALNGFPVQAHLGKSAWEIVPDLRETAEPLFRRVLETGETITGIEISGETPSQPGILREWVEEFYPLKEADGTVDGVGAIVMEVTEQKKAQRELHESEARLRLALDCAEMGAWDWDLQRDVGVWDARQYELCGYAPDSKAPPIGLKFFEIVHPDDRDEMQRVVAEAVKNHSDYRHEFRIIRPDGEVRWLAGRGRFVRNDKGEPIRMVGLNWDITEQKRADERQQLLMAELNHRVKNMLLTIQSISAQTMKHASSIVEFQERFAGRLKALARGHDMLVDNTWQATSLGHLLNYTLAPYTEAGRVSIASDDIWLSPQSALAFNLIVHELATNAAKYGALSNASGHVTITCRISASDRSAATFLWREEGGPTVKPPRSRGFGMVLITRSASYQMNGQAELNYRPEGLECVISFSTPNTVPEKL